MATFPLLQRQDATMTTIDPRRMRRLLLAAALLAGTAQAADNPPVAPDRLAPARAQIKQENWTAAIDTLMQVNDPASADWNNLMGYALRKKQPPDYAAAERYYDEALRLDPKHRGALEYSGELYLLTNRLPQAEARLAALDKACFLPCEEYTDLKKSIASYKAKAKP
jgi:Flp pilus assembly protein TadD